MDNVKNDLYYVRLIQISENSKRLSEQFKRIEHPSIPWTAVYGLRNRIVHDYGNVDLGIIYDTLKTSIPELQKKIENALNSSE